MKVQSYVWKGMAALLTIAALSPAVKADDAAIERSNFSIGPRASFYNPRGEAEGKWHAGAQMRFFLGDALALEGSIDYRKVDYPADIDLKIYPVQASLLGYLAPKSPVSPYLLGGAGWYFTKIETPFAEDDSNHRFGLHAGGGLEVKFNQSLSIDAGYRYLWIENFTSKDQAALDKEYEDSGSQVTVALNVHF